MKNEIKIIHVNRSQMLTNVLEDINKSFEKNAVDIVEALGIIEFIKLQIQKSAEENFANG